MYDLVNIIILVFIYINNAVLYLFFFFKVNVMYFLDLSAVILMGEIPF